MRETLSSLIRGWRAALVLVAAACLTPDRASAGCGDHVTILNGSSQSDHQAGRADPSDQSGPSRLPCQGPNCSGEPLHHQAPLAPVTTVTPQGKEIVQTLLGPSGDNGLPSLLDRDFSTAHPIRRASSVFHPPRIG
jgi:hypothetical protein